MNEPTPLWLPFAIVGGFAVGFPLMWMAVVKMVAVIGGWGKVAAAFPLPPGTPEPPGWHAWTSGRVGWSSYRSALMVGPSEQGLHLWTVFLFRAGHPRVLVPWDRMEVEKPEDWFFITRTVIHFPGAGVNDLHLYGRAGEVVYEVWLESREAQG